MTPLELLMSYATIWSVTNAHNWWH